MKIDFDKINQVAIANYESLLCEYLEGKRKGRNYVALNPTRADTSLGSFQIHIDSGKWVDFATGDKGGDPVSLFAYIWSCSQGDSAKRLNDRLNAGGLNKVADIMTGSAYSSDSGDWKQLPFCHTTDAPYFKHKVWGEPSIKTCYKDEKGRTVGYVARYEHDGGKETIPHTFCKNEKTGETKWKWKGFAKPRPIYNLDKIASLPDESIVLLVEGEKCAMFAEQVVNVTVSCWAGGTNAVSYVDFEPLKRHNVFFWSDNDEAGIKCAEELEQYLPNVSIVYPDTAKPKGYDIADYIENEKWTRQEINEFIRTRLDRKPEPPLAEIEIVDPIETKPSPEAMINTDPFLILGKNDNKDYCYYSKADKHLHILSACNHNKNNYLQLADWQYWVERFEGDNTAIVNYLIKSSQKKGMFDPSFIRGRGVFLDDGRTVYHAGNFLIVDGEQMKIDEFQSRYIYEQKNSIDIDTAKPLNTEQANALLEICEQLNFENETDKYLLAGWIAIAPICGVMPWRPHIWITAPSGSGKTWITDNLVMRMVAKTGLMIQGNSTEAGIRQTLQSDARPVLIDEAESEDAQGIKRMQSIMELARQASSPVGGKIIKGSAGGSSVQFDVRSCFYFSSIGVGAKFKADLSRISILHLNKNTSPNASQDFKDLENLYKETFAHDCMADGLRARSIKLAPTIAKNAQTLAEASRVILGSRGGDQYGALLAGAYSCRSDKVLDMADAKAYVNSFDWGHYVENDLDNDETMAFNILLESLVRHDSDEGTQNMSVAELIHLETQSAGLTLERNGIRYRDGFLYVANSHQQLKQIYRETQFAEKWKDQLKRIDDAEDCVYRFLGNSKRCVKIPYSI
jgi:putative DNA primase/helicase